MVKAVLFDLDGTLLDRDSSVESFISSQYDRLGKWVGHIPKTEYASRFIELDRRGYVWKDKVYTQLIEEYQIELTPDELLQDYLSEFKHHCVPFPNLIPLLDELTKKSIQLGLITNGRGQFQLDNIRALEIEAYFDVILISEWEGLEKPDARLFLRALNQLQVAPCDSVFVGDHPENDVKAANNVGMQGVWKRDSPQKCGDADVIIDDLLEVLEVMRERV
ncbi:HAD family hydrolase [Planococcus sp. YIM B11945]|uniref:HAD family hydrolase n=1 Tax=Planococcus sp. YIM B11945 TaxID=3435410 RepID=UPI003D7E4581